MTLTILQVAFPFAPVGPDAVGGAEQALSLIERSLPRFGHRAVTVAGAGSSATGPLLETPLPAGRITPEVQAAVQARHARAIEEAIARVPIDLVHMHGIERSLPRFGHRAITVAGAGSSATGPLLETPLPAGRITPEVQAAVQARHARAIEEAIARVSIDLVHMHGIDFHRYLPPPGLPVLVTLHLPPGWYPPEVFRLQRPDTWLHAVSPSQHRACPPCPALLPPIENGVPVEALRLPLSRRRFALVLGRICPEKNQHAALEAGRRAGLPVLLGGQVFPYEAHERYWREAVLPRLRPPHRFLGPLGLLRKRRLLNAARCLVSASLAPETSSLVAMEAMACSTPVIAFPSGALADIVEDGVTGFLVRDAAEMAAAMSQADRLCAETIRRTARRRFSADAMLARYVALYEDLARRSRSHAA